MLLTYRPRGLALMADPVKDTPSNRRGDPGPRSSAGELTVADALTALPLHPEHYVVSPDSHIFPNPPHELRPRAAAAASTPLLEHTDVGRASVTLQIAAVR
jgi:hypothetical protein